MISTLMERIVNDEILFFMTAAFVIILAGMLFNFVARVFSEMMRTFRVASRGWPTGDNDE